jgi:membrane protein YdbS with pleckstrin-like domain
MSYARNLLSRGEEVVFETRQHWFAVFAEAWLYGALAILALAVLIWQSTSQPWDLRGALQVVALVVLLGALVRIGFSVWAWQNQEYLVTSRRIIKAEGILNKAMGDSSLEKINDAHLTQSWLGRIFGFGHLDIMTASDEPGALEDFPMMADAVQFKIAMMNQKQLLEHPELARPPAQRPAPPPMMQRAEALPPRAGSDRVQTVPPAPHPTPEPEAGPGPTEPRPDVAAAVSPAATEPPRSGSGEELAATLERLAGLRDRGLITPEEYETKKRDILERM